MRRLNGVENWHRGTNIFNRDIIFFPVQISEENHWILIVAWPKRKLLQSFDSLGRARPSILQDILCYLERLAQVFRWNFRATEWALMEKAPCMQQPTGSVDCGVYVCLYAEKIATGTSVTDLGALDGVASRKGMASALRRSELFRDEEPLLSKDGSTIDPPLTPSHNAPFRHSTGNCYVKGQLR
ncbi:uncharacterized protein LOC128984092 [Macrosteles quadrilineatus]|uniref:uncharacterized protein LOC128984092 n=1 Tax=Macrosteles quadrilineatus TaxID=74068 RepID=UPI0023E1A670|nr:uncharacterized protein LOC128984092 [Macrosteles quadrilineatus]